MDKGGLMLSGGQCRRKHTKTSEQTALSPAWEVPKLQRGNGYTGVWADVAVDSSLPSPSTAITATGEWLYWSCNCVKPAIRAEGTRQRWGRMAPWTPGRQHRGYTPASWYDTSPSSLETHRKEGTLHFHNLSQTGFTSYRITEKVIFLAHLSCVPTSKCKLI